MKMLPPLASLRQRVVMPRLSRPDLWLLIATSGLVGLGIVMVFNASYFYAQDRYGDAFLLGGLILHYAENGEVGWCLLVIGILLGAFVTSYAKARGENFIPECSVGVFERAERVIVLALGSLIPPLLPWALVVLFVGTHATALQRIFFVRKSLRGGNVPTSETRS